MVSLNVAAVQVQNLSNKTNVDPQANKCNTRKKKNVWQVIVKLDVVKFSFMVIGLK